MQSKLTLKQRDFLNYLEKQIIQAGKAPSLRQAAADMNVSHAAISQIIKSLEEKGMLRREGRYSRTIHLLNRTGSPSGMMRWLEVPVVGHIAAGLPLYAQQQWDGTLVIDASVYRGKNLFALKVEGNSMKNAAILDGDLVICEPRQFATNGEIIAALIHQEEATIKRFFLNGETIELRPENPDYQPVFYNLNEVLIQGKVIGVQRGPDVTEKL
jgi:repressor LexA